MARSLLAFALIAASLSSACGANQGKVATAAISSLHDATFIGGDGIDFQEVLESRAKSLTYEVRYVATGSPAVTHAVYSLITSPGGRDLYSIRRGSTICGHVRADLTAQGDVRLQFDNGDVVRMSSGTRRDVALGVQLLQKTAKENVGHPMPRVSITYPGIPVCH